MVPLTRDRDRKDLGPPRRSQFSSSGDTPRTDAMTEKGSGRVSRSTKVHRSGQGKGVEQARRRPRDLRSVSLDSPRGECSIERAPIVHSPL